MSARASQTCASTASHGGRPASAASSGCAAAAARRASPASPACAATAAIAACTTATAGSGAASSASASRARRRVIAGALPGAGLGGQQRELRVGERAHEREAAGLGPGGARQLRLGARPVAAEVAGDAAEQRREREPRLPGPHQRGGALGVGGHRGDAGAPRARPQQRQGGGPLRPAADADRRPVGGRGPAQRVVAASLGEVQRGGGHRELRVGGERARAERAQPRRAAPPAARRPPRRGRARTARGRRSAASPLATACRSGVLGPARGGGGRPRRAGAAHPRARARAARGRPAAARATSGWQR